MANGRMNLSVESEQRLGRVMSHLELNDRRPDALRLAFVKGLRECKEIPPKKEGKTGFVIPDQVIAKGAEYVLYKHLIIEKVGRPLDAKGVDDYMLRYIEAGLEMMEQEIASLSELDNYMLYLVDKYGS